MTEPTASLFPLPPDKWHEIAARLKLSPTQRNIVELILRNRCDKQIERTLGMPHSTLRTHLKRIYLKAEVLDRQELILRLCAMSHGLCQP